MSSQSFTTSNEKIKFGSYPENDLETELYKPASDEKLNSLLTESEDLLENISKDYKEMLNENPNEFNERSKNDYGKETIKYYLYAKELQNIYYVVHHKLFPSSDILKKANLTKRGTPEEITQEYLKELENLKEVMKEEYEDDIKVKIKKEINVFLKYFDELLKADMKDIGGKIFMEKVVLLCKEKLKEILEKMNEFKKIKIFEVLEDKEQTIKNKTALCDLLYQFETMKYLAIILYNTMKMNKDDLFNKEENFEKWQKLKGKYERIISNEPEKMKEALDGTKKFYKGMMTFSENCLKQRTGLMKAWDLANFSVKMDKSMLGLEYEYNKIKLKENVGESIEAMANIIKNGAVKIGMKAMYPSIEFRRKLYLKKKYAKIDRDLLYDIIQSVKQNKPYELDINKIEDVYKKEEEKANVPQDNYLKSIKKEFKPYYVSTRLISNSEIIFPNEERNFISAFLRPVGKGIEVRKKLMIYIHGGEFVGGTTFGEEKFLRNWANTTGIPIIGIDYSIAPANKYPSSLNDCWQAYHWILDNALENFAIDPQKIILAGDSAGGNLVLALTYLLIATNSKKLPDLLMALYPASDVSSASMSPSMVRSLDDILLSTDSLFYINDAYRGTYESEEDPFLSPWRCNKFILEKLPKTRFFLADIDPFRDASIKLAAEIASIDKVDFKAYEFKGALHAFVESQEEVLKKLCNEVILGELTKFLEEEQ